VKSRKAKKVADDAQACRWCGRSGPVSTLDGDVDYDTIFVVTVRDLTVHPPETHRHYVCYECRLWENAIEERCQALFGICTDAVRQAAMERYLDQGRWLSIADLNEIGREHIPPKGFVPDNLGMMISPYGDSDEEENK